MDDATALMAAVPVPPTDEPHVEVATDAAAADAAHAQLSDVEEEQQEEHHHLVAAGEEEEDDDDHHGDAAAAEGAEVDGAGSSSSSSQQRRRSGSTASSRLRVNDKGEPLAMMLPSFIWDYFVKDDTGKFVVCTLCPANATRFAYSGGTSTMNRHLRKKHHKFAPGKSAADYEYPKAAAKRQALYATASDSSGHTAAAAATVIAPPPATASSPLASVVAAHAVDLANSINTAGVLLPPLSPTEAARRQLIDLRNARRRATSTKRRRLLHGMLDADQYAAEFDPSAFVTLSSATTTTNSAGLHFPPGFDLSDAGALDASAMAVAAAGTASVLDYTPSSSSSSSLFAPVRRRQAAKPPQQQQQLTHRLLKYLIAQYEPLDVSRMGHELAALVHSGSTTVHSELPSEDTLKLALAQLYYSQRELLKDVLADVDVLSLSLHNWKSVFGQNVLTVSGHWISHGFRRRDCVLEVYVLPLDESVNTIALLRDVMDKWGIAPSKVAALTRQQRSHSHSNSSSSNTSEDTAADLAAIHDEYPGLTVVHCFVGVLDHAVSSGLRKCAPLIRRCRNYVSYFIQNPSEYQIFLSLQRKNSDTSSPSAPPSAGAAPLPSSSSSPPLPSLSVICDFEDRWNSTSEMIARIVELEQVLRQYKRNLEGDTHPTRRPMQLRFVCCELSEDEWTALKELARLLEPIEGVVHVQGEYPTLAIVLPLLHSLRRHVDDAELWVATTLVASVRSAIASALARAGPLCACGAMAPTTPYLACLLDPRFKTLPFLADDDRRALVDMLRELHSELVSEAGTPGPSEARAKKTPGLLLHALFPDASSGNPNVNIPNGNMNISKTHVDLYLDAPPLPATDDRESDPLDWWARYVRAFPWLAKLAKKFLCLSAVSVPFDEAFTNYGQLMREKKARLDIEVAAQILFCRSVSRIPEMDRTNV